MPHVIIICPSLGVRAGGCCRHRKSWCSSWGRGQDSLREGQSFLLIRPSANQMTSPSHTLKVKVSLTSPTLCDPMDYTVHGILQARILKWVVFLFSRGSSWPRDQTRVSCIAGGFFTSWATREAHEGQSDCLSLPADRWIPSRTPSQKHPESYSTKWSSQHITMKVNITDFKWNYRMPKDKRKMLNNQRRKTFDLRRNKMGLEELLHWSENIYSIFKVLRKNNC